MVHSHPHLLRQSVSDWIAFDSVPTISEDEQYDVPEHFSVFPSQFSLGKRESFGRVVDLHSSLECLPSPSKRPCWRLAPEQEPPKHVTTDSFSQCDDLLSVLPSYLPLNPLEEQKHEKFLDSQDLALKHLVDDVQDNTTNIPTQINAKVLFHSRGNGNQPWEESCASPEKIGKMRHLQVELSTSSPILRDYVVSIRVKEVAPFLNKGKLLICREEEGKTGKTKKIVAVPTNPCLDVPISISSDHPVIVEACIKPEWGGCGENKQKQKFSVIVQLSDEESSHTEEIITWNTQIQSHKFESSKKGKEMEMEGKQTKTKTLEFSFP